MIIPSIPPRSRLGRVCDLRVFCGVEAGNQSDGTLPPPVGPRRSANEVRGGYAECRDPFPGRPLF
eukprot:2365467-Alexandrium_andersonii.AAC.1